MTIIEDLFSEIKQGNVSKVKEILTNHVNLANQYLYGATPLIYSIESNREEVALALCSLPSVDINSNDNLNASPLERAIENKCYKVVEEIVRKSKKSQLDSLFIDDDVETLLTSCLKKDDQNIAIALINGRIDVNKPNKRDEYPIELAIRHNKIDILKSMIRREDCDLSRLKSGYSPLLDACEKDLTEAAMLLIDSDKSDVNIRDTNDEMWTPLMHAIGNNNELLVSKLLEKGADVDVVDTNGNSALHTAVINDNEYIVAMLLRYNARKDLLNRENLSPLDLAKINESEECVKLLNS